MVTCSYSQHVPPLHGGGRHRHGVGGTPDCELADAELRQTLDPLQAVEEDGRRPRLRRRRPPLRRARGLHLDDIEPAQVAEQVQPCHAPGGDVGTLCGRTDAADLSDGPARLQRH